MKRLSRGLLCVLCLGATAFAAAQTAPGVVHAYAFMTQHQPGNIPVDPNGRPLHEGPDTVYTVYVETTGQAIQWKAACIDGRMYSITAHPVAKTPFEAGFRKRSKEKVLLPAARGNHLWRLDFGLMEEKPACRQKKGEILLEGKRGNKNIMVKTSDVAELWEIPAV